MPQHASDMIGTAQYLGENYRQRDMSVKLRFIHFYFKYRKTKETGTCLDKVIHKPTVSRTAAILKRELLVLSFILARDGVERINRI